MKKIGLVLSGGSAYGFAHIGVLKVLEKNGIKIDIITGTSMGSIVGGLSASGLTSQEMEKAIVGFSKRKIFDINIFGLTDGGFLYGRKAYNLIKRLAKDKTFEDCDKKFACIAADLNNGEKVVFNKGQLAPAIRASISVPGLFKPVKMGKRFLVDGGVVDNLPVDEARKMGADIVIAVDVCSHYKKQNQLKTAIDIIISSSNLTVSKFIENQQDKGDIYIKIDQPNVCFDRFSYEDAVNSIKNGEKAAKKMLPDILKILGMNKLDGKEERE